MELKQQKKRRKRTNAFGLLIAPLMELKLASIATSHLSVLTFNRTAYGIETAYTILETMEFDQLLIAPLMELKQRR